MRGWFRAIAGIMGVFWVMFPAGARAADVTLTPSLHVRGGYDDNIRFGRADEIDDASVTVSPKFTFDYRAETYAVSAAVSMNALRHFEETDFNTENYRFRIDGDRNMTEKLRLRGGFDYLRDTTLDTELEETGILTARSNRDRYDAGAGLSCQIAELSSIDIDYSYQKTEYESPGQVDYDYDEVSLSYSRRLKSRVDVLALRPVYSVYDSDLNTVGSVSVFLGWSHSLTEIYSLSAFAGPRHTQIRYRYPLSLLKETEDNWGYVADLSLVRSDETWSARAGYTRTLIYSSLGDPIENNRFSLDASRRLTKRLGARFLISYSMSESTGFFSREDTRNVSIRPSVNYMITQDHRLEIGYEGTINSDRILPGDQESERSRIWIGLTLNYPQKW